MEARIGGYRVMEAIGRGGYGEVVAAVHDVLGREVAIKVLHPKWCDDDDSIRRFVAEARAVTAVRHPSIIEVVDFGRLDDGRYYYVMERLRGETLRARLRARGRLPIADAAPILRAIAAALDAAHDAGIVHRDVKPENVFLHVGPDGEVAKLIDFGLAKHMGPTAQAPTQSGVIIGTPAYMAPEQCRGGAVDARCDTYAFGVVTYEVLTGSVPHAGDDAIATLLAHVHDEVEPPSERCAEVPRRLDPILAGLLAKPPAARPERLVPVVDRLCDASASPAPHVSPHRWRRVVGAVALGVGSAALIAVGATRESSASLPPIAAVPAPIPAPVIAPDAGVIAEDAPVAIRREVDVAPARHTTPPRRASVTPEDIEDPYAR
ncbi:MAG: serine/threonine protein kinase [Deltaproteobacteria bacterium]|nr:serine/threonine protein kinase [Deltaproteobacteria bacterium]